MSSNIERNLRLLSSSEVAAELDIDVPAAELLIQSGQLEFVRLGDGEQIVLVLQRSIEQLKKRFPLIHVRENPA